MVVVHRQTEPMLVTEAIEQEIFFTVINFANWTDTLPSSLCRKINTCEFVFSRHN